MSTSSCKQTADAQLSTVSWRLLTVNLLLAYHQALRLLVGFVWLGVLRMGCVIGWFVIGLLLGWLVGDFC